MLSLVSLAFTATCVGVVVFQIINKLIPDAVNFYQGRFEPDALKFSIAAIIIAAPIYYLTSWQINKSLRSGALLKDAAVRRWLTYFILFVASVTMIGWFIRTIYNFLDGEMTVKFILKAVTAIFIAAAVFSYYFFDIRRDKVEEKDRIIKIYFYASLALVLVVLASAFAFSPSPTETRGKKQDNETLNRFSMIDGALNSFYSEKKKLPESLKELVSDRKFLAERYINDAVSGEEFGYKVLTDKKSYELCATFKFSNRTDDGLMDEYLKDRWPHDAGYQCVNQGVYTVNDVKGGILPIPRSID
jgi:hypothetical protein